MARGILAARSDGTPPDANGGIVLSADTKRRRKFACLAARGDGTRLALEVVVRASGPKLVGVKAGPKRKDSPMSQESG